MADLEPPSCVHCEKAQVQGETPLQRCSRCHTTHYCSRDCQKADWKNHKKTCGKGNSNGTSTSGGQSANPLLESLLGLNSNTWLHDRPASEVYTLLIDSHRMRIEDEMNFRGDFAAFYDGGDPVPDFRKFLQKAEKAKGVLPSWWNEEKRNACIVKGQDRNQWSCLYFAVEKSDIQEHYKTPSMPMQLRMLAEEILGSNVMSVQ